MVIEMNRSQNITLSTSLGDKNITGTWQSVDKVGIYG